MKKKTLVITGLSLIALMIVIGLGALKQIRNEGLKSAKEWAMMAVEQEHYQLADDGYLITHTAVIQTPSLELMEEVEGKAYEDYLYVKDDDGDYYMALFRHSLVVEGSKIKEYVYISAIAWRFETKIKLSNPTKLKFTEDEIIDIDIAELEW